MGNESGPIEDGKHFRFVVTRDAAEYIDEGKGEA